MTEETINNHLKTTQQVLTITYRTMQIITLNAVMPDLHLVEFFTLVLPALVSQYLS